MPIHKPTPHPQPFLLKEICQHFRDHSFTGSGFVAIVVESNRIYCNTSFWRTGLLNLYFKISEEKWITWISRGLKAELSQRPGEKFPWVLWRWPSSDLQFSSVAQLCPTLCDPMNCSMQGLPVNLQLPEFSQTHVHQVGDAIQPSHPLSSPSPPAPNPSQHQSFPMSQLFAWGGQSIGVSALAWILPSDLRTWESQTCPFQAGA